MSRGEEKLISQTSFSLLVGGFLLINLRSEGYMVLNLQMNELLKGTEDESTDCGFEKGLCVLSECGAFWTDNDVAKDINRADW